MSEDTPPPPPPETDNDALSELKLRVADLEAAASFGQLDSENQYRDLLISEVRQRIRMRYAVSWLALFVILMMAGFAAHAVHKYFIGPFVVIPPSLAIVLFLAPATSITAITITLLVGVFRRFKDDDMEKIDARSIINEAVKVAAPK